MSQRQDLKSYESLKALMPTLVALDKFFRAYCEAHKTDEDYLKLTRIAEFLDFEARVIGIVSYFQATINTLNQPLSTNPDERYIQESTRSKLLETLEPSELIEFISQFTTRIRNLDKPFKELCDQAVGHLQVFGETVAALEEKKSSPKPS